MQTRAQSTMFLASHWTVAAAGCVRDRATRVTKRIPILGRWPSRGGRMTP